MSKIKENLAKNLLLLRKQNKLTQAELAASLNYSDKSVSKWENAETVPDIEVLSRIADFYKVSINALITENSPELKKPLKQKLSENDKSKVIISILYTIIVFIAATIVYVQVQIWVNIHLWIIFVWSVPISLLIFIILHRYWLKKDYSVRLVSVFVWAFLLAFYLQFLTYNIWVVFFIGVPIQIANILIYQLKKQQK